MINEDGYNYDEFLSESSDDCPKYADGITPNLNKVKSDEVADDSSQCSSYTINQNNDDCNYKEAYQKSSSVVHKGTTENLKIALINVLEMAKEYCTNNLVNADKVIADESIRKVQKHLGQMKDSNVILAKDNKD
tara:strand:+ start:407 stop:808 length:402 start_codon:yes stop_codon:yes gene_type:complete